MTTPGSMPAPERARGRAGGRVSEAAAGAVATGVGARGVYDRDWGRAWTDSLPDVVPPSPALAPGVWLREWCTDCGRRRGAAVNSGSERRRGPPLSEAGMLPRAAVTRAAAPGEGMLGMGGMGTREDTGRGVEAAAAAGAAGGGWCEGPDAAAASAMRSESTESGADGALWALADCGGALFPAAAGGTFARSSRAARRARSSSTVSAWESASATLRASSAAAMPSCACGSRRRRWGRRQWMGSCSSNEDW
jgi:hypothetical protein